MLQLKVNSEFVDLGSDPVISLEEESPVFDKDSIPGGFSFPFSLPVTERNRQVFQFPERIEKSGPMTIESNFELYYSGLIRATGKISITEASNNYRAYLAVGSGSFAKQIGSKKLKEVSFGGERTWVNKAEFTQSDNFTLFPIYNPAFLNELSGYNWEVNDYKLNHYSRGQFADSGTFAICPFPFLSYVISCIFNQFGYSISENVFSTDPELRKLVLYSTFDATTLNTITESKWVQVGIDPYDRSPIEEWIDVITTTRKMDKFNLADSMPDESISNFFKWLRNRYNVAFIFDRLNNVKIIRRDNLLTRTQYDDITSKAIGSATVRSVKSPDGIKLSWDHDTDDSLFAEPVFRKIDDNLEHYKGTVANSSELASLTPIVNDIYYIEALGTYVQFTYHEDIGDGSPGYKWEDWSIGFQNYWTGSGGEVFHSGISTLRMVNFQRDISGATIRCPWTEQLSNGMERKKSTPFTLRALLYQGLQKDSDDVDHPMGSSDNLDVNGVQIPGAGLTLKADGEFGIFAQLWELYLSWWVNRKQVNWIISDPSELDFGQKYCIDRNHFLLKKRSIDYTLRNIIPGECEFYHV